MDISTIGLIAALLTTGSFLPQVIKVIKNKCTSGLSLGMYIMFCCGTLAWVVHGINHTDYPLIIANGLTFLLSLIILARLVKEY